MFFCYIVLLLSKLSVVDSVRNSFFVHMVNLEWCLQISFIRLQKRYQVYLVKFYSNKIGLNKNNKMEIEYIIHIYEYTVYVGLFST